MAKYELIVGDIDYLSETNSMLSFAISRPFRVTWSYFFRLHISSSQAPRGTAALHQTYPAIPVEPTGASTPFRKVATS
ncbi:hypothetical protein CVT26_016158 [Gymnopilus dilepis]|uniref:Uncharacterized protein n=1 Tax=Gymnopilus dilepis TaxID=231916 RepID=A0A409XYT1_9AGAR|nr:hypothetical protein CVT26_016158 [Gymnopilus dilepis]